MPIRVLPMAASQRSLDLHRAIDNGKGDEVPGYVRGQQRDIHAAGSDRRWSRHGSCRVLGGCDCALCLPTRRSLIRKPAGSR